MRKTSMLFGAVSAVLFGCLFMATSAMADPATDYLDMRTDHVKIQFYPDESFYLAIEDYYKAALAIDDVIFSKDRSVSLSDFAESKPLKPVYKLSLVTDGHSLPGYHYRC